MNWTTGALYQGASAPEKSANRPLIFDGRFPHYGVRHEAGEKHLEPGDTVTDIGPGGLRVVVKDATPMRCGGCVLYAVRLSTSP